MVRHHGRDHDDVTPGYLSSMLSQLQHCFDARGRLGTWDPLAMSGNPVRSFDVGSYRDTYSRKQHQLGRRKRSAVPLSEVKYQALLDHVVVEIATALDGNAISPSSKARVLLLHCCAANISLTWECCRREHDVNNTHVGQVYVDTQGTLAVDFWARSNALPEQLLYSPNQIKTSQAARPETIVVPRRSNAAVQYSAVWRLQQYFAAWAAMHGRAAVCGPLFQSKYGSGQSVKLTTDAANVELKRLLKAIDQNGGETMRGFRRGRVQQACAQGATDAEVGKMACIRTPAVLARYQDVWRHLA